MRNTRNTLRSLRENRRAIGCILILNIKLPNGKTWHVLLGAQPKQTITLSKFLFISRKHTFYIPLGHPFFSIVVLCEKGVSLSTLFPWTVLTQVSNHPALRDTGPAMACTDTAQSSPLRVVVEARRRGGSQAWQDEIQLVKTNSCLWCSLPCR